MQLLAVLETNGLTRTMPATWSPRSSASRSTTEPPIDSPPTTTASHAARSRSNARLGLVVPVGPGDLVQVLPAWCRARAAAAPRRRTPARRGPAPHGFIEAGEPVNPCTRRTPIARPPVRSGARGRASGCGGVLVGGSLGHGAASCRGDAARHCRGAVPAAGATRVCRGQCAETTREGVGVLYWFLKWIALGPWLKVVFRPHVEGAENVPASGPAILASNHLSYADWLFMPLTLPRRVTFVAKAEYFTTPGIKGWFQKKFFSGAGQVPIDRSGANAAEGALASAREILGEGDLFGIYPEGTRSHDGRLYRGKTGVARLALETGVPVIPVAVLGTDVVAPPGKKFGTFTRPRRALRQAAGLLALRGHGERPLHPARDHRRDHVRDHAAVRPGVRRHVRHQGQGAVAEVRRPRPSAPSARHAASGASGEQKQAS